MASMVSGAELRELIESPEIVVCPQLFDGISAKVLEDMGFESVMMGGGAISNSRLAKSDFGYINLTDMEEALQKITKETDLAIQVDADTGYGNALNVYHTVRSLERAGAALIMIEDQVFPKRCGHFEGKDVIPMEEMLKKVEAAMDGRRSEDTLICARTDAAGPLGVDEAIRRLDAYHEAGADLLLADALLTEDDIRKVAAETTGPLKVNMGFGLRKRPTTPLLTPKRLEEMGVAVASFGRITRAAAVKGIQNALGELLSQKDDDEVTERPDLLVSQEEYTEIMGLPELREQEEYYALD